VQSSSTFSAGTDVAVRALDQGAVLVDMRSGSCFELNRVGYEVWLLIQDGKSEAAICEALAQQYATPLERVAVDVRHLLRTLAEQNLIRPSPIAR
jgi:hypothetical protein